MFSGIRTVSCLRVEPKDLKQLTDLAIQENVTRWIKRLYLRSDFQMAIEVADKIEDQLTDETTDKLDIIERRIWRFYAETMLSLSPELDNAQYNKIIQEQELLTTDITKKNPSVQSRCWPLFVAVSVMPTL